MAYSSILDDVIGGLQPEDLPMEYIVLAKVIDNDGVEKILRGKEVTKFLNDPDRAQGIAEARVILDMSKIRHTIVLVLTNFFEELNHRVALFTPPDAPAAE